MGRSGHKTEQLNQVCYYITKPKKMKREIVALVETVSELTSSGLLLIICYKEEAILHKGALIQLLPAWKWLLNIKKTIIQVFQRQQRQGFTNVFFKELQVLAGRINCFLQSVNIRHTGD